MKKSASKKSGSKPASKRDAARKTRPKPGKVSRPAEKSSRRDAGRARGAKSRRNEAKPVKFPPRKPTPEEIAYQQALAHFEKGLSLFGHNDFAKARTIFQKLTANAAQDLAERARVYLNICNQRLARPSLQLKTTDDFYNYAVRMANQGNHEEAEQYLTKALKLSPKFDYLYYALATTQTLRENTDGALESLKKAIELNERNRYLAQNDPDFSSLLEDPRFTELIYPEKPLS
jgi:tetratricopeptide (TPR) repeat protein